MQSLTLFHLCGVWENPNVKVFDKARHLTDQKHVNYLPWTHTKVEQFILYIPIHTMYVATIQHLNYSRQESEHLACVKQCSTLWQSKYKCVHGVQDPNSQKTEV